MSTAEQLNLKQVFRGFNKPIFNPSLVYLVRANGTVTQHPCFRNSIFEKILCRSAFRKQFGLKQCDATLNIGIARTKTPASPEYNNPFYNISEDEERLRKERLKKMQSSQFQMLNVHWAAEQLVTSIKSKKNVKSVIFDFLRDVKIMFRLWRSSSLLKGVRVEVKGRLGRKKKALSQKAIFSLGSVPLSTVRAKIDFDQRAIQTKLGSIGFKLWFCYA
jgi:hypothetical protein